MQLLTVMGIAHLSRINGGIIYNHIRSPISKEDLQAHINKIKNGEGEARYYHLDEETRMLTRFDKKKGYQYFTLNSRILTLREFRSMSLAFECKGGFDLESKRYRKKWLEEGTIF